jgi:hypothetical protein
VLRLFRRVPALLAGVEEEANEMGQTPHGHEENPILTATYIFVICFGWIWMWLRRAHLVTGHT